MRTPSLALAAAGLLSLSLAARTNAAAAPDPTAALAQAAQAQPRRPTLGGGGTDTAATLPEAERSDAPASPPNVLLLLIDGKSDHPCPLRAATAPAAAQPATGCAPPPD